MAENTKITSYLTDFSGETLTYPKNLMLREYIINLSGTTDNSVIVYESDTNQYEPVSATEINDEVHKSFVYPLNNLLERLNTTLFTQGSEAAISNTNLEKSIFSFGTGSKILPPEFFSYSKTIKTEVWGKISSDLLTPTTFNLRYKLNNSTIAETGSINLSGFTNETFKIELITTSRFVDISGTTTTQGLFTITQSNNNSLMYDISELNISGTTIDNSVSLPIDITIQWGTADTDNSITSTNAMITRYN